MLIFCSDYCAVVIMDMCCPQIDNIHLMAHQGASERIGGNDIRENLVFLFINFKNVRYNIKRKFNCVGFMDIK